MAAGTDDTERLSRRIVTAMIVVGSVLTVLSFAMNLDLGRLRSTLHRLVDRATTPTEGVEIQLR